MTAPGGKPPADAEPDLAAMAGVRPGHLVLDLASGRGRASAAMVAAGARVVLLDRDQESLRGLDPDLRARVLLAAAGDGAALPFPAALFDAVVLRAAVHHIPEPVAVLREAARVAKPGGAVLLVDKAAPEDVEARALRNAVERLRHSGHVWSYSERELRNLGGAARLEAEAGVPWIEVKDASEWIAGGTCVPPWDGLVREYLEADRAAGGKAFGGRAGPDGALLIEDRWTAVLLRKPGGRP